MKRIVRQLLHSARPPVCDDVAAWARSRGLPVTEIHAPVVPPVWPDSVFGELIARLRSDGDRDLERPQHLVTLTGARVRGVHGFVILPDGAFCLEGNWLPRLLTEHPDYQRITRPRRRQVTGPVFSLPTYWGAEYYHWFHEAVPRLITALPHLPPDTRFLIGARPRGHQVETLRALGIGTERLVELDPREECVTESLYFATPLGNPYVTDGVVLHAMAQCLQALHAPNAALSARRLWVSRAGAPARRVANETDIIPGLEARGFEVVRPEKLPFPEQVRLFAGAACVAGPHGAGLINLMHLAPGGSVFEVFERTDVRPFYAMMADQFDLHYAWHGGERVERGAGDADMRVEPESLFAALDAHLAASGQPVVAS